MSVHLAVSLEDAHRPNDLTLFTKFKRTNLIVGVVDVAKSRIETQEEIKSRVRDLLTVVPKERLILAPDCGLGFLPREVLRRKLANMVAAASDF